MSLANKVLFEVDKSIFFVHIWGIHPKVDIHVLFSPSRGVCKSDRVL